MRLATLETRWAAAASRIWKHEPAPPVHLWPILINSRPYHDDVPRPAGSAKTPVVMVRVNHGVWQTVCPFCGSAQHASPDDRRFYCGGCANEANGHQTLPVKWPANAKTIEEQLAARPLPRHRNWEPGETLTDLKRQDKEWRASG